jgi:multidrug efflux pump subunit AcrB
LNLFADPSSLWRVPPSDGRTAVRSALIAMWIVRLALRQPYTVAVMSFVLLLMGWLAMRSMPVDIFPVIDIPVVAVVWNYNGFSAQDMESRIVLLSERNLSATVNGISRIESESIPGVGLIKIFFQPGIDIGNAIAQITSSSQTALRAMPPGVTPPYVVQSNASSVPVAQLTLASETLPEQQISDYGQNFIRLQLFTIPGLATPSPYGGKVREITVDVDPQALSGKGLSAEDVLSALLSSNLLIPAGTARIGDRDYNVAMNSSPSDVADFNNIPVKVVNGAAVLIGDVAKVRDGFAEQENIVRIDGRRAAYLTILKKADASTLAVVDAAKEMIPRIRAVAPQGLQVRLDFDQSIFVRAAVESVVREALIAAVLVSAMILLFVGSWRSVLIAVTSIPLSIAVAVIVLHATGNGFNVMTLGGLSLSIGLLVDNAIVTVENVHRNLGLGKPLTVAILDAAAQISTPLIVATLAICIVFFPVVLLVGPARFLFIPMAIAVVSAVAASWLLSRTLVKTLSRMLLSAEVHAAASPATEPPGARTEIAAIAPPAVESVYDEPAEPGPVARLGRRFNDARDRWFARFQEGYGRFVELLIVHRRFTLGGVVVLIVATLFLPSIIGTDFFPSTDAGMMKIHFRAPSGTRIEQTEQLVAQAEQTIRRIVPPADVQTINSTIGVPQPLNLAFVPTDNVSEMDAEILVALNREHKPTDGYVQQIRHALQSEFPGSAIYFQTADIVGQVLNFGLSAPIDVQIMYPDLNRAYITARTLRDAISEVPGATDVTIKQTLDYPTLMVNVDRERAAQLGLSQRDVANSMLVSLSSSAVVSPTYYISPTNHVNYLVAVEVPLPQMTSTRDLMNTPITRFGGSSLEQHLVPSGRTTNPIPHAPTQTLDNVAQVTPTVVPDVINHYTVARVLDVTASVSGRDLGAVVEGINTRIARLGKLPPGMYITVRGQGEVMNQAFSSLALGFVVAILLVYFLMVVLFQSWLDPLIIMAAIPGAIVGILWILVFTHTTINVVSLMGSIMAVGIGVSNSILVVTFAHDLRVERRISGAAAAIEAGKTRLRPVLMTALAMILGMIPTAIGMGEGSSQNAPLGRAVIGGLVMATVFTLCIVPVVYSLVRRPVPERFSLEERFKAEEQGLAYDEGL